MAGPQRLPTPTRAPEDNGDRQAYWRPPLPLGDVVPEQAGNIND